MKGQQSIGINDIGPLALGIGVAVIVVSIIALILAQMIPATYLDRTVNNHTFDNTTTLSVGHALKSWSVYNDTTQLYAELPAANYTVYTNNGTLIMHQEDDYILGLESVNYVYNADSNATYTTNLGLAAVITISSWFSLVVIVVVAVIILSLVLMLRGRGGTS